MIQRGHLTLVSSTTDPEPVPAPTLDDLLRDVDHLIRLGWIRRAPNDPAGIQLTDKGRRQIELEKAAGWP